MTYPSRLNIRRNIEWSLKYFSMIDQDQINHKAVLHQKYVGHFPIPETQKAAIIVEASKDLNSHPLLTEQ